MQGRKINGKVNDDKAGSHAAEVAAIRTKGLRRGEILADVYSRW